MTMLLNPYRFGTTGGVTPTSDKWRLFFPTANSTNGSTANSFVEVAEVEMRATVGGADLCTGGTASASNEAGGFAASNAFANDGSSSLWSTSSGFGVGAWLEYDFASPVQVVEIGLMIRTNNGPTSFILQYWDGSAWQDHFACGPLTRTGTATWYYFTQADAFPLAGYDSWRIYLALGASTSFMYINEMQMRLVAGGADFCFGVAASAFHSTSGFGPANAIDNGVNDWASNSPVAGATGNWLQIDFPYLIDVAEISITARGSSGLPPRAMDFQYYDPDLASWVTKWSVSGLSWSFGETKVFTAP